MELKYTFTLDNNISKSTLPYKRVKKVVGIISYLPDDPDVRIARFATLNVLIEKLNSIFNLPIMIVAQNYKVKEHNELVSKFNNLTLYHYSKLGIAGAREQLRRHFLATDYEVIILVDDDSIIRGDFGKEYLRQIDEHPGKIYEMYKSRHKLMAIHRDIYKLQSYDTTNTPEAHLAYEDRVYFWTLIGNYGPSIHYRFRMTGLVEDSLSASDINSSWSRGLSDERSALMVRNTNAIIEARTHKRILDIHRSIGYVPIKYIQPTAVNGTRIPQIKHVTPVLVPKFTQPVKK